MGFGVSIVFTVDFSLQGFFGVDFSSLVYLVGIGISRVIAIDLGLQNFFGVESATMICQATVAAFKLNARIVGACIVDRDLQDLSP